MASSAVCVKQWKTDTKAVEMLATIHPPIEDAMIIDLEKAISYQISYQ